MASNPHKLTVVYAHPVRRELGEIWDWNAKEYGAIHATEYIRYLERCVDGLGAKYGDGNPMSKRTHLMEITFRRSRKPRQTPTLLSTASTKMLGWSLSFISFIPRRTLKDD